MICLELLNTLIAFLLLVVAIWGGRTAVEALKASREASKAAQEANEQARRDSIEQTRPYIYVEFIPSLAGPSCYDVRIVNCGKSSARNVRFEYSEWPEKLDDIGNAVHELFKTPRTLPPSCSVRAYWRLEGEFSDGTNEAGLGVSGVVNVFYESDDPSAPSYSDEYQVLIGSSGAWPLAEEGPDVTGRVTMKKFYRLGQVLVRRVGELGR